MTPSDERTDTIKLANHILNRVHADPDDDLAMLSRQFLRSIEARDRLAERVDELERELSRESTKGVSKEAFTMVCDERDVALERAKELEHWIDKGESPMLKTVREQLVTAKADNAVMLETIKFLFEPGPGIAVPEKYDTPRHPCEQTWNDKIDKLKSVLGASHPGTALTQRLAEMEEALRKIASNEYGRNYMMHFAQEALEGKEAPHG